HLVRHLRTLYLRGLSYSRARPALPVFLFTDTPTPEIYTLSYTTLFRSGGHPLHRPRKGSPPRRAPGVGALRPAAGGEEPTPGARDRKSTRLNSSHVKISYAVFCLKKKKTIRAYRHAMMKRGGRHKPSTH